MPSKIIISLVAIFILLAACQPAVVTEPADLVFTNGYVYTVDGSRSVSQAIAIKGNRIVFVGSNEAVADYVGDGTDVRDLGGAMVMPGIHDMHIHALGVIEPDQCDLASRPHTLEQLVPVLQECITKYQIVPGEWLIVLQWGFSQGNEPSKQLPNIRAALDAVSLEHPIILLGDDGHHGAANSAALALAKNAQGEIVGLNAATLGTEFAPFRPMLGLDQNGEPTGGINEEARNLLRPDLLGDMLGANATAEDVMPGVAAKLAENGITSIQDAWVTPEILAMYGWLEQSGQMTFRMRAALAEPASGRVDDIDAHFEALKTLRSQFENSPLIKANTVKLFADGVLEGNPLTSPPTLPVAAVLNGYKQPIFGGSVEDGSFNIAGYVDMSQELCQAVQADPQAYADTETIRKFAAEHGFFPQQCIPQAGILAHPEEFIRAYIQKATEAGFHVHVHALADQAVRVVVDEFAKVKDLADQSGLTQSLAHVQLVHPDDQKRIGELGISAVFTFVWTASGMEYEMMVAPFIDQLDSVEDLYNPDHYYMRNVYPAKSMQDFGGVIVNGSDAPVGSRNPMPLVSLQHAITRGNDGVALNPKESIDIHSAIAAFTINGAKLFGHEQQVASIEAGKIADIIVLDQNIVELADSGQPERIGETRVKMTVFDGKVVFERPN